MNVGLGNDLIYSKLQKSAADTKAGSLQNKLSGIGDGEATDEEMMSVCKEFEAYFVEKVLEQMKKSMTMSEEDENQYLSYFGDMMYQEYAKQIAENGELGLAQQLYESMKRNTVSPVKEALEASENTETESVSEVSAAEE
ncbi:MAG: rod-binding protein [Lachnospiraceae bacterium]|nr:rod-binding protein [Lachnospiraceae bacterium]